uniref:Putative fatty acyl-coa hydrolase medium chain n=1 Tax=Panstrongylus lignarius TaxID=156445 RepID=A0A224XKE7_9HEMI
MTRKEIQESVSKMRSIVIAIAAVLTLLCCAVQGERRVKRIVGGVPADVPPSSGTVTRPTAQPPTSGSEKPLVFVRRDRRSAIVRGLVNDDGTYSFLGIRYAEPPLKRLRFQRPRKLKLKGEVDATKFGPPCAQWRSGRVFGSEDCLFLNIFSPELPLGDGRPPPSNPVLVWIHGGNFKTGSASQYVPTHLVKKGVVVVTVQYRLGSLGFLNIGRKELPGNTGLFDIATAMRWVNDYIRFFGGDPKRITSGGQGSGASSATMMAMNKHTRRRLNGVLAMSGTPVSPFTLDENEIRTAKEVSSETGSCDSQQGFQFVRCMQKLPVEIILKADSAVQDNRIKSDRFPKGLANLLVPGPAEEGKEDERFLPYFILQSPLEAMKQGQFSKIPLLTGVTKEETGGGCRGSFLGEIQKKLLSPNFLQSDLFTGSLNANNGMFINKTVNPQLSSLFLNGEYLKFFTMLISTGLSDLEKVIKHTTDAFFNLPAFITSHLWSKKGNVYLYSFEHTPQKSLAGDFLSGLPLVTSLGSPNKDKKGPEHGDDLMFLFEIRTLEGKPLDNPILSAVDIKVREHFCNMVAEFIQNGKPRIEGGDDWKPFTAEKSNYMIIGEQPKLAENFHKCEMGMWIGDNGILGSSECSVLNQAVAVVTNTIGAAGSTLLTSADNLADSLGVNNLKDQVTSIANPLEEKLGGLVGGGNSNPLGDLFGGIDTATTSKRRDPSTTTARIAPLQTTTTRQSVGGLLGLGGGGGLLG